MNVISFFGVGKRKESSATVYIRPQSGLGKKINGKNIEDYFYTDPFAIQKLLKPLEIIGKKDEYDLIIRVKGGGYSSQLQAIILGLSKAILTLDFSYKPILKSFSLLQRSSDRGKERKKVGKKKARKSPQWRKR